jgi:Domain of unknown function (DUF4412)
MKKLLFIFSFLFLINNLFAQKKIKEGTITYQISDVKSKDAKSTSAAQVLNESIVTMFFDENQQKININMMKGALKMQVFMNPNTKTLRSFLDAMGQKVEMMGMDSSYRYGLEHPKSSREKTGEPQTTGKIKTILGYKCEEYIAKDNEKEMFLSVYITKDISVDKTLWQNNCNEIMFMPNPMDIEGVPMEMSLITGEISLNMAVTKIEEKIDKKEFVMTEGLQKIDVNTVKGSTKRGF